jgi:hypothetical protein
MRYTPDWEPLAYALKRVVEAGMGEDDAKIDLCSAMRDGAVKVQVQIDNGRVFSGGNVAVPPHLVPMELDWIESRPLKRWRIGPMPGQHYEWDWEERQIYLLELAPADVIKVLCPPDAERKKKNSSNSKSAELFVKDHLKHHPDATLDSVREAAKSTFSRTVVDHAYRRQREKNTGRTVRRGPRSKNPPTNSAEK